jgi:hypothetical protein
MRQKNEQNASASTIILVNPKNINGVPIVYL